MPLTHGSSEDFLKNNVAHIAWFTALLATGGIAFSAGYLSNKSKYTHLENEALRKKEMLEQQRQENEHKKHKSEHKDFNKALLIRKLFDDLFNEYEKTSPADLKKNNDFQEKLIAGISGVSPDPEKAFTFHALIEDIKDRLHQIENETLKPEVAKTIGILTWAQAQANNSNLLEAEDRRRNKEAMKNKYEQLELEKAQTDALIQAEHLKQEKQVTATTHKVCQKLEEMSETQTIITNNLEKTTTSLQNLFRTNLTNLETCVKNIGKEIQAKNKEAVDQLIAQAAAHHTELSEMLTDIGALHPLLIDSLEASNNASDETISKLTSIKSQLESQQKELSDVKNQTSGLPNATKLENFISSAINKTQQALEEKIAQLNKSSSQNTAFATASKSFPDERGPEFETE